MMSAFMKRSEILTVLVAFAAQNLTVSFGFRDLAIYRLKSNEQHSSIPKSQKNLLATFSSRNKTSFTNICKTFDITVDVTYRAIETKFGTGVVFWQVHTCATFHCPSSTVTLFSGGGVESTPPRS